jgi:hypothetical protein
MTEPHTEVLEAFARLLQALAEPETATAHAALTELEMVIRLNSGEAMIAQLEEWLASGDAA